ncbi:DUF1700 domain-containing protein [Acholeplasma sp. OttesenSCG-928-E16]|nr:DUF1700 domain-containing protein [Acholeplasma sp. OttesenSCG-928-E16]
MGYNFKENYLSELRKALILAKISNKEVLEIVADYEELYDEAKSNGYSDEAVYNRLGNPVEIAKELGGSFVENFTPYSKKRRGNWVISTAPIFATILFLVIGFVFKLWHPGWLVYMWIPISGILFGGKRSFLSKLPSLSVFVALIAFIILGWFHYWHPGWIVWLLVPVCGVISSSYFTPNNNAFKWEVLDNYTNEKMQFKTHKEAAHHANKLINEGHSVNIKKITN